MSLSTALPRRPRAGVIVTFTAVPIALVVAITVAAGSGQLDLPAAEVLGSVLRRLGMEFGAVPSHPGGEATLWNIRFPRVALAVLVGAALACAGALMQGVFGNPLAEPGIAGVSAGAAVGACLAIVLGASVFGAWTVTAFAILGGLGSVTLVYLLSRSNGRTEVVTLILTGVAVNAIAGAAIAFLTFLGDSQAREQIIFWQLGSLNGTRWPYVAVAAPIILIALALAVRECRQLDLLALGERGARHVGVDVDRLRIRCIALVAVMTAAAVAFCGIIAFVGLVVPHLVRMMLGPRHAVLIPASALGGALLMVVADLFARTAVAYADLPIGMLTALVGGPFFLYLILRTRRSAGGWA